MVIGFTGDPPTDWVARGRLTGIHGGVRSRVAELLGLDVELVRMPWPLMIPALREGTIDLPGLGTAWTIDRDHEFQCSQPYEYYFLGVMEHRSRVASGEVLGAKVELANIRDDVVATIAGGWNAAELERAWDPAKLLLYDDMEGIIQAVVAGQAALGIYDLPNLTLALAKKGLDGEFFVRQLEFDPAYPLTTGHFPVHLVFRRDAVQLRAAADLALDLLKTSGEIARICRRAGFRSDDFVYIW
jgi:ABC-type amino acid transport substrate-binding protein